MFEMEWLHGSCFVRKNQASKYGIYVIKTPDGKIIRIGESSSGLERIKKGFSQPCSTRKGKKNYYAYRWRNEYENLFIDYFNLSEIYHDSQLRRSLEAELTFQIRIHYKEWPNSMTEIHFNEEKREKVKKEAKEILKQYHILYNENI